jgi:PAS domain S-box-containing protein
LLAHVEAHLELGRLRASLAQERAEATVELQERKRAEAALREQTEVVEIINRVGHTLAAEFDLEKLLQTVTDAATALTGAQFGAFFYNVSDAHGESYTLYTLSGVSRAQFAQFPLPRNTALFEPTFRGTEVIRLADVRQDPRYGQSAPYYGLPPGHLPVTSYLAVPVISRAGTVLGGLFFGHSQAGVFTERHEQLVVGLAAQAAVAVDNARLFTAAQHEIAERQQLEGVLREREQQYRNLLHALPAAVYTCDVQGRITLYNEAAVTLWGRAPEIGKDLWCGSWQIYEPDGTPLPLDQCPMAVALREGRAIRGQEIVIERPDGTRRHVLPYPDPIHNAAGEVIGAVNMLLDLTERKQAEETRERLAAIVDSSDDAIIGQTLEGVITSWNRGAERLYGYTAAEVLGQPLSLLIPPDLPDDLPHLLGRLQRGESIDHYETQRLHKDGTRRDVALTISPIRDSTGRVVGASKIARDITERKRAEAALQQAYAELEQRVQDRTALLALIHDITVAANTASSPAAALQVAVERICAYTGWPVGHAYLPEPDGTGQWVPAPIWHLADRTRWAVFQQVTQAAPVAPDEGLVGRVGTTGAPAWSEDLRTALAPWQQHAAVQSGLATGCAVPLLVGQEVVGILAFYAEARQAPDATLLDALLQLGTQLGRTIERARAIEQAHRQQEALFQREKLAAMSTLLASVAHELNNPLATILLQAELVREDVRGGPLSEPVTEIADAAMRCERLVRQFLTLARQHPPERAVVALNTLVAETVELLAYPFRVDNVAVHLHLDDQLPPLWGDPHQLQQVLINLLTNAQQALRAAAGAREVTCTTQYDPAQHRITLTVADTGPGIPLALQARIFEPFFTTKPSGVGTGLGLPLCRGIIEAHGGTLEVTSAPDHGATFRITLPVGAVVTAPPATPGTAEGFTERGHTILIVEDEQSLATGLARLLRRDGHTVDTAANGRLALARLDERTYDLILCDVRMPELDGPSLYRLLERQQPHLCQRCIFLTGDTLESATQDFLEQSGAPCLMKPFSIAEARRAIRRAMRPGHPAAPASAPPATRAIGEE